MSNDFEQQEYFTVANAVTEFDRRLLTVKGWGVTLSLAALGLGFQYRAFGFFLVAAASSIAFWAIEAVTKRHQMRHYWRMREIEVNCYERAGENDRARSAPRMDWSWDQAGLMPEDRKAANPGPVLREPGVNRAYKLSFLLAHVALPHAITLVIGVTLFGLGLCDSLSGFALGAAG